MDLLKTIIADVPFWILTFLGVGFLIFVHELGHFIAAKRCGIRVDTFALGFQPTVFGVRLRFLAFTRGETEYVIGMIPFGGYVRMAGEELTDAKTGSEDEYASKSASERALVLVAGSAMNILFAFIFFIVAFAVGVKFVDTTVGRVAGGSAAWEAGIRPGDRIISVDDKEMSDFFELQTTLALAGLNREIPVVVERGTGEATQRHTIDIRPKFDRGRGMPMTGIGPSMRPRLGEIIAGSAAEEAGLQVGDWIRGITLGSGSTQFEVPADLTPAYAWDLLVHYTSREPDGIVNLLVERDGAEIRVELQARPTESGRGLGVSARARTVALARPGSEAATMFQPGEEIVEISGSPVHVLDSYTVIRAARGAGEVTFKTADGRVGTVATNDLVRWLELVDLGVIGATARVETVSAGSTAATLGIEVGHTILSIDGVTASPGDMDELLNARSKSHEITWWDGAKSHSGSFESDGLGVTIVQSSPRIGNITPGSGAIAAGIQLGDALREVNGSPVRTWGEFVTSVRKHAKDNVETPINIGIERAGTTENFDVVLSPLLRGQLGIVPEINDEVRRASVWEACVLGSRRAVVWAKKIFLTVKALVKREVSPKNLAGPLGIVNITKQMAKRGIGDSLFILALISLNLGMFNLFPIPILDGGHLLFLAIEKLKGSPVSEKIQYYAHLTAFVLLISLAVFVTYHDILRWRW